MISKEIFRITNLSVSIKESKRIILENVNFSCFTGEIFVILGKNGSGKSTLALSLTKLLSNEVFNISGEVCFKNKNIYLLDDLELLKIRQKKIGYIMQNPFSAFDPIKKIRKQFEYLSNLKEVPFSNYIELMKKLELRDVEAILEKYPFELSGGMLQRLAVVKALLSTPELIIADEPTSALDRPITIQLMDFLSDYVKSQKSALIIITQDISIAEKYSDKIAFLDQVKLNVFSTKTQFFTTYESVNQEVLVESYKFLKL